MDSATWNERYRASSVWSGQPNAALVASIDLPATGSADPADQDRAEPTALDLGCGEGADALWLATQGWSVVGVDWAEVAVGRARDAAREQGLAVRFVVGDIDDVQFLTGLSPTGHFDLVTVAFLHPEPQARARTFAPLAQLVAPGGRLFVLTHDPEHGERGLPGPPAHRLMSPDMVLGALSLPADFTVERREVNRRTENGQVTAVDGLVLARRGALNQAR